MSDQGPAVDGRFTPVILCGGIGTRLWPISRKGRPKQFVPVVGSLSLFQQTLLRIAEVDWLDRPLIVTGRRYVEIAERQMREIDVRGELLVEPDGRNSLPAVAAAAVYLHERDRASSALILASDHFVELWDEFKTSISRARNATKSGSIVVFGVSATFPSTGYGYIVPGPRLESELDVYAVQTFTEKPDSSKAHELLANGCYWNSGNLAFRVQVFLDELASHNPLTLELIRRSVRDGQSDATKFSLDQDSFMRCPSVSVDTALLELSRKVAVVPINVGWSDVGTWSAVWELGEKDADENVLSGTVVTAGTRRSLVRSEGPAVVAVGVEDLVIVATGDAVLVCRRDQVESVKQAVGQLEASGLSNVT